jgi:Flp pilus assembly protein TadG
MFNKLKAASASLRTGVRHFAKDNSAVALIEAAITLPVLIFVSFTGLEVANLMVTHTRISGIVLAVADNSSRIASGSNLALPQVREVDVNDVFTGAQLQAGTIDLQGRGRIILSSLEVNSQGGQWIHWQRCFGNFNVTSAYGVQGTGVTGTAFPGMGDTGAEIQAEVGAPVMFAEISYNYDPAVWDSFMSSTIQIDYDAAFSVRDARDTSNIFNPNPAATVRTCPTGGTPRKKRAQRGHGWGNTKNPKSL